MRLARTFLGSVVVGILVVLAAYAVLTLRREIALFDTDMVHDHEVLARALSPAFSRIWQLDGEKQARDLLERINARERIIEAQWVEASPASGALAPQTSDMQHAELSSGSGTVLVTSIPTAAGGKSGYIEIRESTAPRHKYVKSSLLRTGLTAFGMFLWCSVTTVALGILLIGRPVKALADQARRIGLGEFSVHGSAGRKDELGDLGREMDAMADRLASARQKLSEETDARLRALNQLRHADRLATVGKLASGIAHELGTPLNVVGGRAKIIRKHPEASEDIQRSARIIEEQADRMANIIRQVLNFARAGEPTRRLVDVVDLAERVVGLLSPVARKNDVTLALRPLAESVQVSGEANQLEQVLTNLVVNAVHASTEGSTVTVAVAIRPSMRPGETECRSYAVFDVIDDGCGMPPHVASRVFEPFFTTKDVGEGTGLGLSVAYGIVQEHGGFMTIDSTVGHGSRFSVYLPI